MPSCCSTTAAWTLVTSHHFGPAFAAVNSVAVTMCGLGSHGARPEMSKDPVVLSAEFILMIQTIVSHQTPTQDPAVVTVAVIRGSSKRNIIPDEVKMGVTIRSVNDRVQKQILADLKRTAEGIAIAGGVPSDRMPMVAGLAESSPLAFNDPEPADRLRARPASALWAHRTSSSPGPRSWAKTLDSWV